MKTIGIIGGLGPETTSKFYLQLIFESYKLNKKVRPSILMWSVPMDYRTEEEFISGEDRSSEYVKFLVDAAKRLEAGGADFIVIPCNSVHVFIKEVRNSVTIPVLSIVEETIGFLKLHQINSVGLLATTASIKNNLYQSQLDKNSIKTVLPSAENQQKIGVIINKLVRDQYADDEKAELGKIISSLADQNVATILLACTDLQLLAPSFKGLQIIDTMNILIDSTVKNSLNL